jgi:hypothetical protein
MRPCGNKKCGIWMVAIIPAVVALHSYAFFFLWNLLITDIFSLRSINFWEALGLVTMAKLLFMTAYKGGCHSKKHSCHSNSEEDGSSFKKSMREHFKSKYCCSTKDEDKDKGE